MEIFPLESKLRTGENKWLVPERTLPFLFEWFNMSTNGVNFCLRGGAVSVKSI